MVSTVITKRDGNSKLVFPTKILDIGFFYHSGTTQIRVYLDFSYRHIVNSRTFRNTNIFLCLSIKPTNHCIATYLTFMDMI